MLFIVLVSSKSSAELGFFLVLVTQTTILVYGIISISFCMLTDLHRKSKQLKQLPEKEAITDVHGLDSLSMTYVKMSLPKSFICISMDNPLIKKIFI